MRRALCTYAEVLRLALSSEMALCLHAVQFIFFPRAGLDKSFVHGRHFRDNLQHFQWRIQLLQEVGQFAELVCLLKSKCSERAGNGFSLLFQSCVFLLGHTCSTPNAACCFCGAGSGGVVCRVLFYFVANITFRIVPGMNCYEAHIFGISINSVILI